MYIVMDLVINHCSDQHEWFQKAVKDSEGEYSDYFYFVKGKNENPPSNYRSYFGGSVWEKVPGTDKYYRHLFAKEQPDLNWENPVVRQKLFEMVNWWLEKGIAGFRIDAIINIKKNLDFPDYEADGPDGLCACTKMVDDVDGIGEFLQQLKLQTFKKYDAFTVGEVFNMKSGELEEFVGEDGYFSTMFDFAPHMIGQKGTGWYENEDGVKMPATVQILLRGLPFLYQGQEIGMTNCRMKTIDEYEDIDTIHQYQIAKEAGLSEEDAMEVCYKNSRDNARTPMQWSDEPNAGFTKGTPWFIVNGNYKTINVKSQENDENSVLNYYRKLIALRKNEEWEDALVDGEFIPAYEDVEGIMAFYRKGQGRKILVLTNFGKDDTVLTLKEGKYTVLLSNKKEVYLLNKKIKLAPCEAVVLSVEE